MVVFGLSALSLVLWAYMTNIEVRQYYNSKKSTYLTDYWNYIDILSIITNLMVIVSLLLASVTGTMYLGVAGLR